MTRSPAFRRLAIVHSDRRPNADNGFTRRDYAYKRHETLSLLTGIDLIADKVHSLLRERHQSADFIDFLKLTDATYPEACVLFMVLNNHTIHTSRETRAYPDTRKERFQLVFTTKHAS